MSADAKTPEGLSLRRWSRRKLDAARARDGASVAANAPAEPQSAAAPAPVAAPAPHDPTGPASARAHADALPPVDSLTIESDFAPFFQASVDETLKRQALKQLLRDPRFNVMDGLDVYVDDYSIPDPISADVVKQMVQGRYIFDPPPTRINAQGHAEDVPPEDAARDSAADPDPVLAGMPPAPATVEGATESAAPPRSPIDPAATSDPGTPEPPAR